MKNIIKNLYISFVLATSEEAANTAFNAYVAAIQTATEEEAREGKAAAKRLLAM